MVSRLSWSTWLLGAQLFDVFYEDSLRRLWFKTGFVRRWTTNHALERDDGYRVHDQAKNSPGPNHESTRMWYYMDEPPYSMDVLPAPQPGETRSNHFTTGGEGLGFNFDDPNDIFASFF